MVLLPDRISTAGRQCWIGQYDAGIKVSAQPESRPRHDRSGADAAAEQGDGPPREEFALKDHGVGVGQPAAEGEAGAVVALGATGTNLVSIRERMATWQPERVHGAFLDYEEVSRAVAWLSEMIIPISRSVLPIAAQRRHSTSRFDSSQSDGMRRFVRIAEA